MSHITIHRGAHQIGGCVTEIAAGGYKVFLDAGENLSSSDKALPPIQGLTAGDGARSALFLTHYHGDHVGLLPKGLPEIPIYMGQTAKAIQQNYAERVRNRQPDLPGLIGKIKGFAPLERIQVGGIAVTPLMIDHSAFDAYMFIVEAEGRRILYTGDFRLHGVRGKTTPKMLAAYAKDVDYMICEGTTLSRDGEPPMTEKALQQKAKALMQESKYAFVLCGSTHIDRIGAFYHANPKGRLFVCDAYQKKLLETVREFHAGKSGFCAFERVYGYAPNLDAIMEERGFCMLIRQGELFGRMLEKYKGRSLLIYSLWTGYLDDRAKNQGLCEFLAPYRYRVLHTSGHASPPDLKRVYDAVKPKRGLIPIHTDAPEQFRAFVPEDSLIFLEDGVEFPM
jgi:ribonuclease J